MKSGGMRSFGKRALYGVVAGTCVLIGVAALVLQFATRPAPRMPLATAASTPAPGAITRAVAPPPTPRAATAVPASVPVAVTATATPAPTSAAATARAPIKVASAQAPAPAATIATAAPAPIATVAPATVPDERQGRCIGILQKASLEKITAAETEFFKKECK